MSDTARFALPLLDAAQAQKHMTVNEALARADALLAGEVEEIGATTPPADPAEGRVWSVGPGSTGDWTGADGRLAFALGGGWVFADLPEGWQARERATGRVWRVSQGAWRPAGAAVSPGGATLEVRIAEVDHALAVGATSTAAAAIPDKAVVLGVTGRVISDIGGATGWSLGVDGAPTRYGSGFGAAAGSFAAGVTGQPQAYYGATGLLLTAEGGDFSGGTVRLAVHYLAVTPPEAA